MAYKFNPFTGKLDYYEAAGASGATIELDNLGTTAINADLLLDTASTYSVGNTSKRLLSIWADNVRTDTLRMHVSGSEVAKIADAVTLPSGATAKTVLVQANTAVGALSVITDSSAVNNATATSDVRLETGNKTAGTGDSGNIIQQPGTSSGGDRGYLYLNGRIINANQSAGGSTTITPAIRNVYSTTGASDIVLTLPAALKSSGSKITFMKVDSGAGSVEIAADGSETIGADLESGSRFLYAQEDSITLFSNGSTWLIVSENIKNRIETKTLSADVTTNITMTDLSFSNLIVGRWYEISGRIALSVNSGSADTSAQVDVTHNSAVIDRAFFRANDATTTIDYAWLAVSTKFKAAATTLTFVGASLSSASFVSGNSSQGETYIQLEERNDLATTTAF